MKCLFHVTATCVRTVDLDPHYKSVANKTDVEFELLGYPIEGDLHSGMFANVRPHLRRGKYYRIASVEKVAPDLKWVRRMSEYQKELYRKFDIQISKEQKSFLEERLRESLEEAKHPSYTLKLLCVDQSDFQELYAMDIKDEDVEIFKDLDN